jgi:hypothetical protein
MAWCSVKAQGKLDLFVFIIYVFIYLFIPHFPSTLFPILLQLNAVSSLLSSLPSLYKFFAERDAGGFWPSVFSYYDIKRNVKRAL